MLGKIKIALFDSDGFMDALVNYFCGRKNSMIEPCLFTDINLLKKYLEREKVDVLLLQEEMEELLFGLKTEEFKIILLSSGNMVRESGKYESIFRYQSVENIVKEVMDIVADDEKISYNSFVKNRNRGEIICGFSPWGGGEITSILWQKANKLSKYYKTLFVSLECFCGFEICDSTKKKENVEIYRGMSEVIFYLKQKKDKLVIKLESLINSKEQLDYILPVEDYRDLQYMTKEDMGKFLEIIWNETSYEKVVFAVEKLDDSTMFVLENADKILLPASKNQKQKVKEKSFVKNMSKSNKKEIVEKIVYEEFEVE